MEPRRKSLALALAALIVCAAPAAARAPLHELAGIRPGMSEHDARERLDRSGVVARAAHERQDRDEDEATFWQMKSGPWGYVALGFVDDRVDWITAFARPDGAPLRFGSVGPLAAARRPGNFLCVWDVAARGGTPAYSVIARGRDSLTVTSISLKRTDSPPVGDPDRH